MFEQPFQAEASQEPNPAAVLMPPAQERQQLFELVNRQLNRFLEELPSLPVSGGVTPAIVREHLARYDFVHGLSAEDVIRDTVAMMTRWNLHSTHPRCFGLFNPTPAFMGVLADTMVAAFNPQLAVWSHSPVACEMERHLIRYMGTRMGWSPDETAGSFTTGGAEANLTGLLLALTRAFRRCPWAAACFSAATSKVSTKRFVYRPPTCPLPRTGWLTRTCTACNGRDASSA